MALALALAASTAAAQDLPALHDVTGVAAGDVLNLRSGPLGSAAVVGTLAPDARGIEVLATRSSAGGTLWAQVALPEGSGWAAARFLARRAGQDDLPWLPPLACGGTEPFWSLEIDAGDIAAIRMPGFDPAPMFVTARTRSANDPRSHGFTARWDGPEGDPATFGITGAPVSGVIRRDRCSDGMSDRPYGFGIDAMLGILDGDGRAGFTHLTGCCALRP